ncbi:hypothetical protein LEP1GSC163_0177 [Leptospira santarosai str. CBC379]|uniref:hypothetical protein n=1 Tax=Leptospira santarosai TaxID=28183 RepID=UPI00029858AB|nr:hypothetical protein [Leptospira santarosai]EKR89727.1 hypothetical protein LEP1GSC163_0177 [Leptospira santarosai str. CBC379]
MSFFKEWHDYNVSRKDMNVYDKRVEMLEIEIEEDFKNKHIKSLYRYCADLECRLEDLSKKLKINE